MLIILLFNKSVSAQDVQAYWKGEFKNNLINLTQSREFYFKDFTLDSLTELKFDHNDILDHYIFNSRGMSFNFDRFKIDYSNIYSYNLVLSDSAMSFVNRLNSYNYKKDFDNVIVEEEKINFDILKISYKKEFSITEDLLLSVYPEFNYYQGNNYEYNIYDLDINISKSNNPFNKLPLIINGTAAENFNTSSNNKGFGFGIDAKIKTADDIEILFSLDNLFSDIYWRDLQLDALKIDSETAYKNELNNWEYSSVLEGSYWRKFDYQMRLPLKSDLVLIKDQDKWIYISRLNWQEWKTGDISRIGIWEWKNSIGYRFHKNNVVYFGHELLNEIYNLSFKNEKINLSIYFESINFEKNNKSGFELSYNLRF
ncbi:MAG: hypothetical protein ACOCV1_07565 [Bacillota bacterium]